MTLAEATYQSAEQSVATDWKKLCLLIRVATLEADRILAILRTDKSYESLRRLALRQCTIRQPEFRGAVQMWIPGGKPKAHMVRPAGLRRGGAWIGARPNRPSHQRGGG
jgi:hypothetical protein